MKVKTGTIALTSLCLITTALILVECNTKKQTRASKDESGDPDSWTASLHDYSKDMLKKGQAVFRYETFGDEAFWTDKLQLHKALVSKEHGGIGDGLTPKQALAAGIKVNLKLLPEFLKQKIKEENFLTIRW